MNKEQIKGIVQWIGGGAVIVSAIIWIIFQFANLNSGQKYLEILIKAELNDLKKRLDEKTASLEKLEKNMLSICQKINDEIIPGLNLSFKEKQRLIKEINLIVKADNKNGHSGLGKPIEGKIEIGLFPRSMSKGKHSKSVYPKNISDINLIIDDLIIWMKKHPYEFDPIVKRLILYSQNSLTSKVVSRSDNRIFELYLLCKEEYRIFHICLIEDYQFTLLIHIDEERNDFRSGSLERNVDNSLKSCSIAPYPVTEKKVSEFYQLFFSWWHQAKQKK